VEGFNALNLLPKNSIKRQNIYMVSLVDIYMVFPTKNLLNLLVYSTLLNSENLSKITLNLASILTIQKGFSGLLL